MSDESASALTDAEWELIESAQEKLEGEEEEITAEEAAALQKAMDAGELEVEAE